jgi:hypothetical protein
MGGIYNEAQKRAIYNYRNKHLEEYDVYITNYNNVNKKSINEKNLKNYYYKKEQKKFLNILLDI